MKQYIPLTARTIKLKAVRLEDVSKRQCSYEVTNRYTNNLPFGVSVIDRNNIANRIPPNKNLSEITSRAFEIDMVIKYTNDVQIDVQSVLSNSELKGIDLNIIKEAIDNAHISNYDGTRTIVIRYIIDALMFKEHANQIYLEQLDLTLAAEGEDLVTIHPYSEPGQFLLRSQINMGWSYQILINDPTGEYGKRYININNRVYTILPVVDLSVKPGVWVYQSGEYDFGNDALSLQSNSHWYSFADADEKIGLYLTPQLARDHGDSDYKFRKELENKILEAKNIQINLTQQLKQKEHEYDLISNEQKQQQLLFNQKLAEYEQEQKERDQQIMRMKHQLEMQKYDREAESRKMNDYYDRRSHERKDTSEFIKWLPTLIGAGIALIGIVR